MKGAEQAPAWPIPAASSPSLASAGVGPMGLVTSGDVVVIQELCFVAPWAPSTVLLIMAQDPWELDGSMGLAAGKIWVCSVAADRCWTMGVRAPGANSSWRIWDEIHGASWPPRLQRATFVFHWTYKKAVGCWPASPAKDKEGFALGLGPGQLAPDEVPASVVNGEDLACPVFLCVAGKGALPLSCMLYKLCCYTDKGK